MRIRPLVAGGFLCASMLAVLAGFAGRSSAQEAKLVRLGERLTYAVRLEGFENAGMADLHVASEGKFGGTDVFEVGLKLKTFEIVNAAFFPVDETRTSFISKESGMPQAVRRVVDGEGFPAKTNTDYFNRAPYGLDLVSAIYKLRQAGGAGEFRLTEGGKNYWVVAEANEGIRIRTEAGEFQTIESRLRSEYFSEIGISDVRVFLSSDELRIPVLFEFVTRVGKVSVRLVSNKPPEAAKTAVVERPSPTPAATPKPPAGKPTPAPYVENRPLGDDVPFKLGEKLSFAVRNGSESIGTIQIEARERKQFEGKDALLLAATVMDASVSNAFFKKGDQMRVWVDPGSFLPIYLESKFNGSLSVLTQTAKFDQASGSVTANAGAPVAVPVGTHSLLSLVYAGRAFNLRPASSMGSPVNDTRVAVFWNGASAVFTIRPSPPQNVAVNGVTVKAQPVDVITGDAGLDAMKPRIWFTTDAQRTPVKLTIAGFSLDLLPSSPR